MEKVADYINGYNIWVLIWPPVLLSLSKCQCRCRATQAWNGGNWLDLQALMAFQKCLGKKWYQEVLILNLVAKEASTCWKARELCPQRISAVIPASSSIGTSTRSCFWISDLLVGITKKKKNQYPVPSHLFPLKLSRFCWSPVPSLYASRFLCTSSSHSHSGTGCSTLLFSVSGWSCSALFLALICWTAGLL